MNFQELQNKIGTQNKNEWHQHKNGGGWVNIKAKIDDSVFVGENAIIFSGTVYGNAQVSGDARVSGNAWEKSPLFIIGTKHSLTNCKKGFIQIGRHCKEIDWWLKNGVEVAKKEGYTPEEIKEYREYVKLFKKIGK